MPTTVVPVADRAELTREAALRTWNLIIDAQGRGDGYARIVLTGGGAGIGTLRDILALHQSALAFWRTTFMGGVSVSFRWRTGLPPTRIFSPSMPQKVLTSTC